MEALVIDLTTPQALVAQQFMRDKGYKRIEPCGVEQLDDQPCWYFLYQLPEGDLELEVFWNAATGEWETLVTCFSLAG